MDFNDKLLGLRALKVMEAATMDALAMQSAHAAEPAVLASVFLSVVQYGDAFTEEQYLEMCKQAWHAGKKMMAEAPGVMEVVGQYQEAVKKRSN